MQVGIAHLICCYLKGVSTPFLDNPLIEEDSKPMIHHNVDLSLAIL